MSPNKRPFALSRMDMNSMNLTGGLLNCQLPAEAISINSCDECCGDVIQGC